MFAAVDQPSVDTLQICIERLNNERRYVERLSRASTPTSYEAFALPLA